MAPKRRKLNSDDQALWSKAVRGYVPLVKQSAPVLAPIVPPVLPESPSHMPDAPSDSSRNVPQQAFLIGQNAKTAQEQQDKYLAPHERLAQRPLMMDTKVFRKMKSGKLKPEGRLDLHGSTLAAAHSRLVSFIQASAFQQKRLVLVITGKGKDRESDDIIPVKRGVLRHHVPQWLGASPLSAHILQLTNAHRSHGGEGAYYVYLRRSR